MTELTLAWPTTGTRSTLRESIRSFANNARAFGHEPKILISVDSGDAACRDHAGGIAADVLAESELEVTAIGASEREEMIRELAGALGDELVRFAIGVPDATAVVRGPGANHNAIQLLNAGSVYLSTDDDVICRPARQRGSVAGQPGFSADHLPGNLTFRESREHVLDAVESVEADVLAEHLRYLGRTTGEVCVAPAVPAGQSDRTIRTTTSGAYGDSGMGGQRTILLLDGPARAATFTSEDEYRRCRLSREVVRIPKQPSVGPGLHLMAMGTGFQNTSVLAPHLSVGRNADGLFAVTNRIVYPDSATAYLGFGLLHAPEPQRKATEEDLFSARPWASDLLMQLLVATRPAKEVVEPEERLRAMGGSLLEVGEMPPSDVLDATYSLWSRQASAQLERLEELLDEYGREPYTWAQDVERYSQQVISTMHDPHRLFGQEGCGLDQDEFRSLVRRYAELLAIWPDVWNRAHQLYGQDQ